MAGPIRISLIANGRQARAELERTGLAATAMGRTFSKTAKLLAGTFAVREIARAGTALAKVGNDYTSQLAKIEALSTKQQQAQVGGMTGVAKALEANRAQFAKYGTTIGEAAEGVTELVKAGQTLPDALKEINGTVQLAKSGLLSVGDASTIVSNAMNTFHLNARAAEDVANKFANAADASAADVTSLADALKYVGPVAHASNVPLDQTLAVLAELSNAGIDASNSGTGFRKFLSSLQAPTGKAKAVIDDLGISLFTTSGKAKPLGQVIGELKKSMSGLTEQQKKLDLRQLFGLTGIASANVILDNGTKGLTKYTQAVDRAGGASRLAVANSAGLVGALKEIRANAISAAQGFYREYSPVVEKALRGSMTWFDQNQGTIANGLKGAFTQVKPVLADLSTAVGQMSSVIKDLAQRDWPLLVDAVKATVGVFDGILKVFNAIPGPLKSLAVQTGLSALAFGALSRAMVAFRTSSLVTGILAARASMLQLRAEMTYTATRAGALKIIMGGLGGAAKQVAGVGGMLLLTKGLTGATKAGGEFGDVMAGAAGGAGVGAMFGPIGALVGGAAGGGLAALISAFHKTKTASEETRTELAKSKGFAEAKQDAQTLADALQGVVNKYNSVVEAAVRKSFVGKNGQLDSDVKMLQSYGVSMKDITEAALGNKQALAVVNGAFQANGKTLSDATAKAKAYYQLLASGGNNAHQVTINGRQFTVQKKDIDAARKAYEDAKKAQDDLSVAQSTFTKRVGDNNKALATHTATMKRVAAGVGLTLQQYKQLPQKTRMDLETNFPATGKDLLDVLAKYKQLRNFKSIQTIINAKNIPLTVKQVNDLATKYKLLPSQVKQLVKVEGLTTSKQQLKAYVQQYGKKSLGTAALLAKVNGLDVSRAQLKAWVANAKKSGTDAGKGTSTNYASGVRSGQGAANSAGRSVSGAAVSGMRSNSGGASSVGANMAQGLANGLYSRADAIVAAAGNIVQRGMAAMRGAAKVQSPSKVTQEIGGYIGAGLVIGLNDGTRDVADASARLAKTVDSSFRATAQISSPSKVSYKLGTFWVAGLTKAVDKGRTTVAKSGTSLAASMNAALTKAIASSPDAVDTLLSNTVDKINKNLDTRLKQIDATADKHRKGATKAQKAFWNKWEKTQDRAAKNNAKSLTAQVNSTKKSLDAIARQYASHLATLQSLQSQRSDMIASVRDSIRGELDLSQALTTTDNPFGFTSSTTTSFTAVASVVSGLAGRARTMLSLMQQALKKGIPKGLVQEVIGLGTEQAIPILRALLSGSATQVKSLTADYNTIQSVSATTGTVLGDAFYAAGIAAQQKALAALTRQKQIATAAAKLANSLTASIATTLNGKKNQAKTKDAGKQTGKQIAVGMVVGVNGNSHLVYAAVQKAAKGAIKAGEQALGIHSPSKAFQKMGTQVVQGLAIGLDDTYVSRQGTRIATSLQKGFGQPELSAVAAYTSGPKPLTSEDITKAIADGMANGLDPQAIADAVVTGVGSVKWGLQVGSRQAGTITQVGLAKIKKG